MKEAFADTSFWAALLNQRDSLHRKAQELHAELQGRPLVTTQLVLVEVLNEFAAFGPRFRALARSFVDGLHQADSSTLRTVVVPMSSRQFLEGVELYGQRQDKSWSLTDCVSYQVMRARGIEEALTHDRDFEQMGFRALLRES